MSENLNMRDCADERLVGWLLKSTPGESREYHRGFLAVDRRLSRKTSFNAAALFTLSETLEVEARELTRWGRNKSRPGLGRVRLFQKRISGIEGFCYFVQVTQPIEPAHIGAAFG